MSRGILDMLVKELAAQVYEANKTLEEFLDL